jgi:hypothetical protein
MAGLSEQAAAGALIVALTALVAKVLRGEAVVNERVVTSCSYILGSACMSCSAELIAGILDNPFNFTTDPIELSEDALKLLIDPVKSTLLHSLEERCADDCARHSCDYESDDSPEAFWKKYIEVPEPPSPLRLILARSDVPCAVGHVMPDTVLCPLESLEHIENNLTFAQVVRKTILFRGAHPSGQFLQYSRSHLGFDSAGWADEMISRVSSQMAQRTTNEDLDGASDSASE